MTDCVLQMRLSDTLVILSYQAHRDSNNETFNSFTCRVIENATWPCSEKKDTVDLQANYIHHLSIITLGQDA